MALYIITKEKISEKSYQEGPKWVTEWHIGEPIPKMPRVVEFQADCDECATLMYGMLYYNNP